MKITGQILKEAREKKGISIAEVSLATKINTRVITAMEDGNLAKLPPKTFLRGFVLSYATFLQLDIESLMNKFQEEFGMIKPDTKPIEEALATGPSPRGLDPIAPNTIAKIGAAIGILILFGLIVLLRNKMESYRNETITAAASPSPTSTPRADATPGYESAAASATPTDLVGSLTSSAAATSPQPTVTPTPKPSASPKPSPTATPAPTVAATATPKPTPKPTPASDETPTPAPKASGGKSQDITLEALDNVSIDATIDDEPVHKITLKPDQVQTIKAKRKVSLQLSDGGAVNIIVNGNDRGVPGDLGQPKKVDIP